MKKLFAIVLAVVLVLVLFSGVMLEIASAATTFTGSLTMKYGQTEARRMLDMVNKFRTGGDAWYWNSSNTQKVKTGKLNALTYDYDLEQIAMQRAAEIAIEFGHVRPNGNSITTIVVNGMTTWGECIGLGSAIYFSTSAQAFEAWQENNEKYAGQGHRRAMLNADFTAIGIGHAELNGMHCWVQEFGYVNSGAKKTAANDSKTEMSIEMSSSYTKNVTASMSKTSYSVVIGNTISVPKANTSFTAVGVIGNFSMKGTVTPDWKPTDSSIVSVSDGKIKGLKVGSTKLTATVMGKTLAVTVRVRGLPVGGFNDVFEDDYYADPVLWAVQNNVTAGTSDTTFSPGNQCTRAQAVTFLWNAQGQPEPKSTKNPFTDVKSTAWYYKAVLWAVENNITAGTSATTFSPNATCTRAQIVTFLHNYAEKPAATGKNPFTDVKSTQWYYQPILWAVSEGVTAGTSATTFSPTNTCTRGQIVTFLYNYLGT